MVSLMEMVMEPLSLVSMDARELGSRLDATSRYKLLGPVGQRHPNGPGIEAPAFSLTCFEA